MRTISAVGIMLVSTLRRQGAVGIMLVAAVLGQGAVGIMPVAAVQAAVGQRFPPLNGAVIGRVQGTTPPWPMKSSLPKHKKVTSL